MPASGIWRTRCGFSSTVFARSAPIDAWSLKDALDRVAWLWRRSWGTAPEALLAPVAAQARKHFDFYVTRRLTLP
jgi:hypothetical protein